MNSSFKTVFALASFFSLNILLTSCSKSSPSQPKPEIPDTRSWHVSTLAGTGAIGHLNGDAEFAAFELMQGIAADGSGNVYVSDRQRIRKISNGQVTTYAGKGSTANQSFGNVFGLAVNKQGIIYVIEGARIRKISSPASDEFLAGNGTYEYKDGTGTNAGFYEIFNLVLDKDENIILPDYDVNFNHVLRKVTPSGVVTTMPLTDNTGISSGSTSSGGYLSAITIDPSGNIYYSSAKNQMIKKRDVSGNVTAFAGTDAFGVEDGKGTAARFMGITGLTSDQAGNIYVAQFSTHSIRKITPSGDVTTIVGANGPGSIDGHTDSARLKRPVALAVEKDSALLIVDQGNYQVRKMFRK